MGLLSGLVLGVFGGSGLEVHVSGVCDTSALEADLFGEMLQSIGPGLELEDGWILGES